MAPVLGRPNISGLPRCSDALHDRNRRILEGLGKLSGRATYLDPTVATEQLSLAIRFVWNSECRKVLFTTFNVLRMSEFMVIRFSREKKAIVEMVLRGTGYRTQCLGQEHEADL